jgi:putative glycosyltransferase
VFSPVRLSVVTTLYRSAQYVDEFYERAAAAARAVTPDYEIVFVNDGSPDDSLTRARALIARDERVRVVDLSRNFGHHRAMMIGLEHARGELVFLIDSDLEEEPELLGGFHEALAEHDVDVVYGVQASRKGGVGERLGGRIFYRAFNLLANIELPRDVLVARLMTRRYVNSLVAHRERELLIGGLWQITGYEQMPIQVTKHATSETTYTLRQKLRLLTRGITAFSNRPLLLIAALGALILAVAIVWMIYLLAVLLFVGRPPAGFTSILVSLWLLGGLIIFSIGVVAIYISVIFTETKARPYAIVRAVYERNAP